MPVRPSRVAPVLLVVAVAIIAAQCTRISRTSLAPQEYPQVLFDSTGPVCVHLVDPLSERICPHDSNVAMHFKPQDVVAETLVVHTTDGRIIRLPIPIRSDAIFIGQYAIENFLLRHYDATNPAKAQAVRNSLRGQFR